MKTAGIAVLLWVVAYGTFAVGTSPVEAIWGNLQGWANGALFAGIPLLLFVPVFQAWAIRRDQKLAPRWWLLVLIGFVSALPLVIWPLGLLSGSLIGVITGQSGSLRELTRAITWHYAWPFYLLYGVFGALLGTWDAVSRNRGGLQTG